MTDERPYSPGLEGVIAAETALGYVDGERGRLLYRGYRIGDLVEHGTYPAIANLLWTGEWDPRPSPADRAPSRTRSSTALRGAARDRQADGRPADGRVGVGRHAGARLAAHARSRRARSRRSRPRRSPRSRGCASGQEPIEPDPTLDLVPGFLYQLNGERADAGTARALDAYFIVGAEHGLNASTFTARVIISTRSDLASAVGGAIGALKGPLHGGAPSEVVEQIHEVGSPEHAEQWVRETLDRGERLMGFGHRVYRAYDPRAAALRKVAESMEHQPEWLELAIAVEDVALRVLAEQHPERPLKTNVEYYAAPVLMGVGLTPDLFPATFALARHAGWTAHVIEQAGRQPAHPAGRAVHRARRSATSRPEIRSDATTVLRPGVDSGGGLVGRRRSSCSRAG